MSNFPVECRPSDIHGFGVFATRDIKKGEVVEECPVIFFRQKELDGTNLKRYSFASTDSNISFLAMGYGGMYNNSQDDANVIYYENADKKPRIQDYVALRDIKEGEELTIQYYSDNVAGRNWRARHRKHAAEAVKEGLE